MVRAVGQGYDEGLAGLARDFGVSITLEDHHPKRPHTDINYRIRQPLKRRARQDIMMEACRRYALSARRDEHWQVPSKAVTTTTVATHWNWSTYTTRFAQ